MLSIKCNNLHPFLHMQVVLSVEVFDRSLDPVQYFFTPMPHLLLFVITVPPLLLICSAFCLLALFVQVSHLFLCLARAY